MLLRFISGIRCGLSAAALPIFTAAALFGSTSGSGGTGGEQTPPPRPQIFECESGPWGRVQWHYIHIETADWILDRYGNAPAQTVWHFPPAEAAAIATFMTVSGVPPDTALRWVNDPRTVWSPERGVTLYPSAEDIVNLSPPTRAAIYAELAKMPGNAAHAYPLRIPDGDVDTWLDRRELRLDIRRLLKHLTYLRGSQLCFSDLPVLLSHATSESEARDLTKLGTRIRCVMAYLQVGPRDDTQTLNDYWSAGFHRKDALPILDSVSMLPGGGRLGLSHLLPAESRKLLYTYPTPDMAAMGALPDCHWTALNFFNENPQNVLLNERLARAQVLEGYDTVQPPFRFGDILVFVKTEGAIALHSCVFLCEELVFTKNGGTVIAPWIISTLSEVQRQYTESGSSEIRGYRRRWGKGR